ncbi:YDG domain-containing protein, partial [Sediminibacterium sp.]|uniref:beta strand repeat-containing protein n=1 Tax=Sediminibacterium sp. TaxID=1917865 RepID=UPI002733FE01
MRFRILRNFLLSAVFSLVAAVGFAQTVSPSTGSITSFSSIYGDASTSKNFSFTGTGFTPGQPAIVIANAESEVSTLVGGPYSSSVSINSDGSGDIASTTIYVRTAESTIPGVYLSKQIRIENAGGTLIGTRTISQITVNTRSLDIINVAIEDKVYDGNTTATVTNNGSPIGLDNLRTADLGNVTISFAGATATFVDANVGSFKSVTVTGYSISGPASAYYTLIPLPAQSGNITAKSLSINAIQETKTYGTALTSGPGFTGFNAVGLVGSENPGTVTVTYGSGAAANANVGTYNNSVVLSALTGGSGGFIPSNYAITLNSANIVVNPKLLTLSGAGANDKVYNGNTVAILNGGVSLNAGVEVGDDCTLDITGAGGTFASPNVGNGINVTVSGYALTGAQAGNYSLTQPTGISANITEKALTITANTVNKPYGDVLTTGPGKTEFSSSGLVPGETIASVTLTYGTGAAGTDPVAATNVGGIVASAPVAGVGFIATNYAISFTAGDLTVAPKALTITATPVNKTYGTLLSDGTGYTGFNAVGLVSGENAGTVTVTYGSGAAANANVGTYNNAVVLSTLTGGSGGFNASNYSISYADGNIVVGAKALTLSGAGVGNKEYDGNTTAILNATTLVGVEAFDIANCTLDASLASGTFASANAANGINVSITGYALTGSAAGNYTLTAPSGITANITPKALGVTANTIIKTYGDVLTSGPGKTAFTSSGLVVGETIASVTLTYGTGAAGTDPVAATNVGGIVASAPVAGVGFNPSNYTITYTAGDLTVGTRSLNINATAVNKIYGDVLSDGAGYTGFNAVGLQNGESAGTVTVAYGTGAAATDPVGTTVGGVSINSLTGGTINPSNYAITYNGTDLNVVARTLNITANNVSKTIGAVLTGGAGSSDFIATGLQNGETAGTVTITYTGVGPTAPATAGVYSGSVEPSAITGGSINAANYSINYIAGDITVSAGSITITATNENKPYGTALSSGSGKTAFTLTGTLQPGETITTVTLTYGAGGAAGDPIGANAGTIVPSLPVGTGGFVASNYIITYVNGDITVTTAPLTITATNETKSYGTALTSGAGKTTFTSVGLASGETIASVTLTYGTGGLATAAVASNVGTIVPSAPVAGVGFNASNYSITYTNGDITVTPAALTVTANAVQKNRGDVITSPATGVTAFTSSGLQNSETIGSVTMNYGTGAAALDPVGVNVGSVVPSAATGGTFTASNYTITYTPNDLTVVPSNNAFLSNLVSNTGPLNTAFNKFDLDYDTYVLTAVNSFIVTATTENQFATIQARIDTGNGPGAYIPLTSGVASSSFQIREGDNIIEILVTAEDGVTQLNYRILYRRESTFVSGGGGGGLESKSLGDAI